jgi:hypothetical protein
MMPRDKSVGASLVLTFLFGPFGLLYTSVAGGIVMIFVWFVVALVTLGVGLLLLWPLTMVWGAVSASNQHAAYQEWLVTRRPPYPLQPWAPPPPQMHAHLPPPPAGPAIPPPPPRHPLPPDQPWA